MNSLFCRHNRFTADCPICSQGTVLGERASAPRPARPRSPSPARSKAAPGARTVTGPYVSAGPYARDDGTTYEVRLERVPGGVRLASWSQGALERRAPVLAASDLAPLVAAASERSLLAPRDLEALESAVDRRGPDDRPGGEAFGASPGRSGLMRDELRVERADDETIRVARWILRPNAGWELQEAPTMLPATRYAEAISQAAERGVV